MSHFSNALSHRASLLAAATLALSGAPGVANAALVCGATSCTETVLNGPQVTDLTNFVLTIDKAPTLANETLSQVQFFFSSGYHSTGTLTNTNDITQTIKFSESVDFTLDPGANAPAVFLASHLDIPITTPKQTFVLASGASADFVISPTVFDTEVYTTGLAGFSGAGTYEALVSTLSGSTISGSGNIRTSNFDTTATPGFTIEYDYVASVGGVPEASTWAMFLIGFAGIGFAGQARRFGFKRA